MDGDRAEIAKGVEVLLEFLVFQTYDESEDALTLVEDMTRAAKDMFAKASEKRRASKAAGPSGIDMTLDTLIALLDKGSSDLRSLANLVMGMVAPAFEKSTIEHLVAVSWPCRADCSHKC